MTLIRCLATLLANALLAGSVGAQSPDLTELSFENLATLKVSSASKFVQSAREAPSAVEIIGREDIRRHGWRTLTEALSSLTGTYSASDRAYDFLGARGFLVPGDYNTRFLLLVDGQRSNDNVYEQASFSEEFPLDLALVERIEYVPGPGSSIYGSNAIFGVINVITRRTEEMPPLQLATRLTEDGWREVRATLARHFDSGAAVLLSVTDADKEGRNQTYRDPDGGLLRLGGTPSPDGVAHDLDRMHQHQLFARYEDGGFSLAARYGERSVQPSSALYGTLFDDGGLDVEDAYLSLLARYQRQLADGISIDARLEYGEMTYRADYPYDDGLGTRYLNRDDTLGRWWSGDMRLLYTGVASHKLVGGVEMQTDTANRQRNVDVGAAINPQIDVDSRRRRAGVYVQDEWHFAERWRLNAGLRHDSFSAGESAISPRVGLIWLASDATTLKLLAGRAFREPNAYERDYANGVGYLANPRLKPESIRTVELVWERRFGRHHTLNMSAFDYRISNLIAQVDTGDELFQYQNQARIQAHGVEATWRTDWESGARLSTGLALNRAEDATGHRPGFSPRWIAKLRGSVPLPGARWLLALEAHAMGATNYRWNGTPQRRDARLLVDAALTTAHLAPGLDGHLRVRNLFDRHFAHPGSDEAPVPAIPGHRRTWELGLSYSF
ncbi:TonB-dependent receptor plug domain-containing protein [Aromatoleum diolicum]|uniref:TonB-dependent receptor plug domain-containing protein n=1 Tax=Aromatoleum diolicum TaxID=75796 RepID=A0ABX1QID5_9RHOO|nr:TonB-dependent receptor [Aromatoleum diolicum]NMG77375.1 TonB-dependent receptor plug domain-containing protein [Aromatoleum diolicum]